MNVIAYIILWTLALYGFFEIIKNIVNIYTCTKLHTDGIYFIVAVKNQENHIEGFFRNLMFKIIYGKEELIKNVMVVDLNSTDHTKEIVEKLQEEYDQLKVFSFKECKELIENIKET